MSIKEKNGFANFLYRIFIGVDDVGNDEPLNMDSTDKTEKELAESIKKIDDAVEKHFIDKKGKSKFKVEESELSKNEVGNKKGKQKGKEEKEDVREI